jgi:hypothetical protein
MPRKYSLTTACTISASRAIDSFVDPTLKGLAVDQIRRRFQHRDISVDHVLDMQVGSHLLTAVHCDHAGIYSQIGQYIHRQVEPLALAITADRRGPQHHAAELIGRKFPLAVQDRRFSTE